MNEHQGAPSARRNKIRLWWMAAVSTLGFGAWLIASLLLHTALFGFVAAVSPERPTLEASADEFTMTISPERVEEVVEEIRARKSEEFQQQVQELMDIQKELEAANIAKVQQYNELMKSEAALAPEAVKKATKEALAAQTAALKAQDQAKTALNKLGEAHATASATPAPPVQPQPNTEAAKADPATAPKDTASTTTNNVAAAQPPPANPVPTAGDQQKPPTTAPNDLAAKPQPAESPAPVAVEQPKPNAEEAKAALEAAQKDITTAQANVASAQVRIEQQLEVFGKADSELRQSNKENADLQNQASKSQKDANIAAQKVEQLRTKEATLTAKELADKARVEAQQKLQAEENAKIAELQAAQPKSRELTQLLAKQPKTKALLERFEQMTIEDAHKIAELAPTITTAIQETQKLEEKAQQAQEKAKEALAKTADKIALAVEKASQPVPVPVPVTPESTPLLEKNLADLYKQAVQTENGLTSTYKQVRAAELAAIRKLPMAEALALTEVAKPVRDGVDTKILSEKIQDAQGVHKQEAAINAASAELESMISLARRMKALAIPDTTADVTVSELKTQGDHNDKMEQLALQTEGARAKDLSGEMGGDKPAPDSTGLGEGNAPQLAKEIAPPSYLFAPAKELKPLPGRTIGSEMQSTPSGNKGTWMFVDSWYLIGPWPNPGRKNLNTKFPPETIVDLNAVYTGGRRDEKPIPVRWHFLQAPAYVSSNQGYENTGQIIPPGLHEFEIYYAYTELWSDTACDLWVAIGSDDQSKIWINDDMIWKSADEQKAWMPNEGLRKVHFRKGINRILYRYENGWGPGCFSFLVSLKSTANAPIEVAPKGK